MSANSIKETLYVDCLGLELSAIYLEGGKFTRVTVDVLSNHSSFLNRTQVRLDALLRVRHRVR